MQPDMIKVPIFRWENPLCDEVHAVDNSKNCTLMWTDIYIITVAIPPYDNTFFHL